MLPREAVTLQAAAIREAADAYARQYPGNPGPALWLFEYAQQVESEAL